MSRYLITLTPTDKFFFGGEMKFSIGGQKDRNASYIIKSNYFPQQTALLGMLRFLILRTSEYFSNGEIVEQMKENVKALIGEKSFSVNEGHDKNDFGAIESITGCFIQMQKSEEKEWIKLEPAGYDTEFNISFTEDKHGFHNGCPLLLPDITRKDPESKKKGLGYDKYFRVAGSDGPGKVLYSPDDIFIEDSRLGINRDIRTGKTENNALYKQKNFRFNTKTGIFRFAFYAEIDESNFDKEFSSSNGKIVSLGADNSNFSIGISKSDKPDREKQETAEGGVCRIVLLSPAFLDPADVRLADFAIAETMPFRFLKSSLDSKSYNLSGGGLARSEKYELYAPGSVFFIKEEITGKDGDRSRVQEFKAALEGKNEFRQIGYNQYRAMRHFPATAVSTTDK